jgi:hypothetical protein
MNKILVISCLIMLALSGCAVSSNKHSDNDVTYTFDSVNPRN